MITELEALKIVNNGPTIIPLEVAQLIHAKIGGSSTVGESNKPETDSSFVLNNIDLDTLDNISMRPLLNLITERRTQELFEKLPDEINPDTMSFAAGSFLSRIVFVGYEKELLAKLPDEINLDTMSTGTSMFLKALVAKGYAQELLAKLPDEIKLDKINSHIGFFLEELVTNGCTKELFEKLPAEINFYTLTEGAGVFLQSLINMGYAQNLFDKLPDKIYPDMINGGAGQLLSKLVTKGYAKELLAKLPDEINPATVSDLARIFLKRLAEMDYAYAKELLAKLPDEINLQTMSFAAGTFIREIVFATYEEEIFEKLPDEINPNTISYGSNLVLDALISYGYMQELFEKFPSEIDLSALGYESSQFLADLVNAGYAKQLMPKLSGKIDLSNDEIYEVIDALLTKGYTNELFKKLPDTIPYSICFKATAFLTRLITKGYAKELLAKLPDEINIAAINEQFRELLIELVKAKVISFEELSDRYKAKLRQPIKGAELTEPTDETVGPSLAEIIAKFPIDLESVKQLRSGWTRISLKKEGSKSYLFLKITGQNGSKQLSLIFRTDEIKRLNLQVYKKALQIIPDYISSPTYQELTPEKKNVGCFRFNGFREVYSGPSLANIDLSKLPLKIEESILLQKQHVLLSLGCNSISHNHPHDYNFNVRFLLESKSGEKYIMFDVKQALERVKQSEWSITPIVTLRDWDAGSTD